MTAVGLFSFSLIHVSQVRAGWQYDLMYSILQKAKSMKRIYSKAHTLFSASFLFLKFCLIALLFIVTIDFTRVLLSTVIVVSQMFATIINNSEHFWYSTNWSIRLIFCLCFCCHFTCKFFKATEQISSSICGV